MKGIREAAMSQEDETPTTSAWPKAKSPSLFDKDFDSDRYDGSYYNPGAYSHKTYVPPNHDIITISMNFEYKTLGLQDGGEGMQAEQHAETKAIEAAYDRVEQLLGKNYESKYSVSFEATDEYDSMLVTVTLTPTK